MREKLRHTCPFSVSIGSPTIEMGGTGALRRGKPPSALALLCVQTALAAPNLVANLGGMKPAHLIITTVFLAAASCSASQGPSQSGQPAEEAQLVPTALNKVEAQREAVRGFLLAVDLIGSDYFETRDAGHMDVRYSSFDRMLEVDCDPAQLAAMHSGMLDRLAATTPPATDADVVKIKDLLVSVAGLEGEWLDGYRLAVESGDAMGAELALRQYGERLPLDRLTEIDGLISSTLDRYNIPPGQVRFTRNDLRFTILHPNYIQPHRFGFLAP